MPCAPLLWNFGGTCQLRLCCLACLVLLCCCVAVLQESLGLERKTRHLRLVLRRREEGCYHDGGIDAIINITDRLPPPQPPPPPLRKPLLVTSNIIIIIGRRIVYLQSAGVVNTRTHSSEDEKSLRTSQGVNCHNFSRNFEQAPVFSINPE